MDWEVLRSEVLETFTPGPPINEVALFAGRQTVIRRLQDTTIERARHAIIFGERGVGKTSLANIFHKDLNSKTRTVLEVSVNADTRDSFDSLWRKVFRRIKREDRQSADLDYPGPIEPDHVVLEMERFSSHLTPVIIIDEYDRIEDDECRVLMTDVLKSLTNIRTNPTIVLVGVAESIIQLVQDHASISRNLVQIPMKRMSPQEINDVILSRTKRLRMKITSDAVWRITHFSAGLPFYAHSLGKYAALKAIQSQSIDINESTVLLAIDDCMADVDLTVTDCYMRATRKIYNKTNIYAQVLAACALAETDDMGQFNTAAVLKPLKAIMNDPEYKISAFSFSLNEMCGPERGSVFRKNEERRVHLYHFAEAAMQPYTIMKSLRENVLTKEVFDQHYARRQRTLSI